jgi:hydroxymethylpyrimidine pyrophosphatase-like HAD family hydrolase
LTTKTVKFLISIKGEEYYDITAKGVSKAAAEKNWGKILDITPGEIIAIGDSKNDEELLNGVAWGIMMQSREKLTSLIHSIMQ